MNPNRLLGIMATTRLKPAAALGPPKEVKYGRDEEAVNPKESDHRAEAQRSGLLKDKASSVPKQAKSVCG